MAQTTLSIRMDGTLKKQLERLCNDFGMNVSTAVTVFAKAVVRQRRIPFEIEAENALAYDPTTSWTPERWTKVREMLAESEADVTASRESDAFEDLKNLRAHYGI